MANWLERTARNEPMRIVKLIHLDGNTRAMRDDGCNQDGRPNQQRAHLLAMLAKRTPIPAVDPKVLAECEAGKRSFADIQADGILLADRGDGTLEPVMAPVFRLAEPPPRFPYERLPERVRHSVQAADIMDRAAPFRDTDGGAWALPSERWKAWSAAWQAMRRKSADATSAMLDDAARTNAGEALEKIMKIVSKRGGASNVAAP